MREEQRKKASVAPYTVFLIFNAVFFMMDTTNSYFNIYLDQLGFSKTMIGTVTSVSSLAAMICQPVFGALLDRSASRTRMLQLLILITACLYPLIMLNSSFLFILLLYTVYFIFRRTQPALNTALTVEFAEQSGKDYGPIRMMGAAGYTAMMFLVSFVAGTENGTVKTFWLYSLICAGNILLLFFFPPMPGHNLSQGKNRVSPMTLLKNKSVLLLILFHILIATSNGLGQSYFPIYVTSDMGASNAVYGIMVTIGSMVEIPFLFLADRIIRRLGIRKTMCLLGVMTAIRWGNSFFAASTGQLFITQGLNFVIILENVTVAILISRQVRPELKTVAQALVATIQGVVGILISSMAGGVLADAFGIRPLFLLSAGIALGTAALFFFLLNRKSGETLSFS